MKEKRSAFASLTYSILIVTNIPEKKTTAQIRTDEFQYAGQMKDQKSIPMQTLTLVKPSPSTTGNEVLVCAAQVVVVGARTNAGQRLVTHIELDPEYHRERDNPKKQVLSFCSRYSSRGNRAPRLVHRVLKDTAWIALISNGKN
ncbi:hypothetical protein CGRA01v4_05213 [Colletotrichum graminicola]|nr:hypothetical protein CGRA01v4_05213 [Colletotrichum graminicola]